MANEMASFIWSGMKAYQEFWFRSNFQFSIQPPTTKEFNCSTS